MQELREPLAEGARLCHRGRFLHLDIAELDTAGHHRPRRRGPLSDISARSSSCPREAASCQFRDTSSIIAQSISAVVRSLPLTKASPGADCLFRKQQAATVRRADCDFGRTRVLDGGLQQDRAKHDGFEKDGGPVQRLERALNG